MELGQRLREAANEKLTSASTETHSRCAPEFQEPGTHANLEDKPGTSRALRPEADPAEREVWPQETLRQTTEQGNCGPKGGLDVMSLMHTELSQITPRTLRPRETRRHVRSGHLTAR